MLKEKRKIKFWNFAEYSKILLKCKREIKTSLANKLKKKRGYSLLLELLLLLLLELPARALEVLPAERKNKKHSSETQIFTKKGSIMENQ